jgi:hypothetical protein
MATIQMMLYCLSQVLGPPIGQQSRQFQNRIVREHMLLPNPRVLQL